MTDIHLSDIESWLRDNARGHTAAKPRRLLLAHLEGLGFSGGDRGLRKAYGKGGPLEGRVGSSLKGVFWIVDAEDRAVAQRTLHAPAMADLVREKAIRESAPCEQMGLFGGER